MKLQPVENPVDETIVRGVASSGLTLIVNPRPDYQRTFAALGTHFGSIDRVGGTDGEPVPEGLAHFLEHKLFEDRDGDVSDRFAELGASTNAMTGFAGTTYIASTVDDPLPCVDLLLDFVQDPWFTDDLVAKEQGIIAQEIRMYDDDPDWRIFFGLMRCLYAQHPVRDNIAGSVESIAEIDAATLQHCYELFYHPNNLCLAVAGGVTAEQVAALVEADQAPRGLDPRPGHVRPAAPEPRAVAVARHEERLPVSRPRLLMGIKETVLGGDGLVVAKRQLATRLVLDALLGPASPAFEQLYADGLIDETFGVGYSCENGFGFSTLGGDTDDPAGLEGRLRELLDRALVDGLDAVALARGRNKLLGSLLRACDSPESVCYGLIDGHFRGVPPFAALAWLDELPVGVLETRLREHVREDALAVSVVRPA